MTNNNEHWNTVDWSEIPEDVEAVVTFQSMRPNYYKVVDNSLMVKDPIDSQWDVSMYVNYSEISIRYGGDSLHLRPTPSIQPTPEPPESTQVESSEVEAATTPEFDWSSVEDDVEAVVLRGSDTLCYKVVDGVILSKFIESTKYKRTIWKHFDSIKDVWGDSFITRPPATTPPEGKVPCEVELDHGLFKEELELLSRHLTHKEFEWYKKVSAQMRKDLIKKAIPSTIQTETYTPKPPSILTILQEAQQSILKHHGVTGKVSFTVEYSE